MPTFANLTAEIQVECSRVRRALPECDHLVANGRLAREILVAVVNEGEASIELGDVQRMTKALAELQKLHVQKLQSKPAKGS